MPAPFVPRRLLLAGAGAAALVPAARAADRPVRIGVLSDMSGPYVASGGKGSVLAAHMAADEAGAVLGQAVEIVQGDTQNKPDIAAGIARQWCDTGIDAIVDLPVTPVAAAVQQVAREKNVTVLITAAAASEFTAKSCAPNSIHWADDTHALASSAAGQIVRDGGKDWFFITVDMAFGHALQRDATEAIAQAGGTVRGAARFPLGTTDYASLIVQAQSSGAQVIGLAAVGNDLVNIIKQASEFGVGQDGTQRLAGFLIYITEIVALGLPAAQGFTFGSGFYWNQNDTARAWSQRFFDVQKAMPTRVQASVYAATRHFLQAVQKTGTRDTESVGRAMRANPVDYLGRRGFVRADGRVMYDLSIYRVKAPGTSRGAWDVYDKVGDLPAAQAFLPPNPSCR